MFAFTLRELLLSEIQFCVRKMSCKCQNRFFKTDRENVAFLLKITLNSFAVISFPWRYIVVGITFISTLSITAMRYCFSLTLTQMVKVAEQNTATTKDEFSCPVPDVYRVVYNITTNLEYEMVGEMN